MRLSMLGLLRAAYTVVAALVVIDRAPASASRRTSFPTSCTHRGGGHCRDPRPAARCARRPRSRLGRRALIRPVANPLGLAALTMMLAGIVAGSFRRSSSRSLLRPLAALAVAAAVVLAGEGATAVVAEGGRAPAAVTALVTVGVGLPSCRSW